MRTEGLIQEWHPALRANELGEQPVSVTVLGESIALFRTSGGVHALRDVCVHRGVPLSLGKVEGDEIVCAYHGWRYDGCGACTRIPSMPSGQAIPSKARAVVYECTEANGFIWVCLGTPSRPAPPVAEEEGAEMKLVPMGPYELRAAGPRVIENFLDVSHFMFVHEGLLGDAAHTEIPDYAVHERDGRLESEEIAVYQPDADGTGLGVTSRYVYEVYHPLCAALTKRDDGTMFFKLYLFVLPVSEERSVAYMLMFRNYALEEPDRTFVAFQDKLIEQDRAIVEAQKPELLPLDLQAELHLKCDRMSIAYRKKLKEWGVAFGTS